jgi:hypothetical protein
MEKPKRREVIVGLCDSCTLEISESRQVHEISGEQLEKSKLWSIIGSQ